LGEAFQSGRQLPVCRFWCHGPEASKRWENVSAVTIVWGQPKLRVEYVMIVWKRSLAGNPDWEAYIGWWPEPIVVAERATSPEGVV
jgi:hypothetical protein